ncbi:sigma-70 family RNA polymerase sigma factor [Candidatus Daviesbacteria bacterium]|nr:sigma-70 family RNA polymerase sigma factor [Candidatus Daviesbacteria bacterium]
MEAWVRSMPRFEAGKLLHPRSFATLGVPAYSDEISAIEVLSDPKQRALALRAAPYVSLLRGIRSRLRNETPGHHPTHEQFAAAVSQVLPKLSRVEQVAKESYDTLVGQYLRMVPAIASSFKDRGLAYEDLIGEGYLAVIRAVEELDPASKNKLATYVWNCVKNNLNTVVNRATSLVTLPSKAVPQVRKLEQLQEETLNNEGAMLSHESYLARLGLDNNGFADALDQASAMNPLLLSDPFKDDSDEGTFGHFIQPAPPYPKIDLSGEDRSLVRQRAQELLDPISYRVIDLLFGLRNRAFSPKEAADRLELTSYRVERIKERSLAILGEDSLLLTIYVKYFGPVIARDEAA